MSGEREPELARWLRADPGRLLSRETAFSLIERVEVLEAENAVLAKASADAEALIDRLRQANHHEAVDCCDPEHWFDNLIGAPGGHDGGLPGFPRTPCVPFPERVS